MKPAKGRRLTDDERDLASEYYEFAILCGVFLGRTKTPRLLTDEDRGIVHFALMESVRNFDPAKGLLVTRIKWNVTSRLAAAYKARRRRLSWMEALPAVFEIDGHCDAIMTVERDDLASNLIAKATTSQRRNILSKLFRDGLTQVEAARHFGCHESRISALSIKGIADIRRSLEASR